MVLVGSGCPENPDDWLLKAGSYAGSWWPHWYAWLAPHGGKQIAARGVGSAKHPPLAKAPGSYVLEPAS